jgi:hypothetical protein
MREAPWGAVYLDVNRVVFNLFERWLCPILLAFVGAKLERSVEAVFAARESQEAAASI